MNFSMSYRRNTAAQLVVGSLDITNPSGRIVLPVDDAWHNGELLRKFRLSFVIGAVLCASRIFHLILLWCTGADWSVPLSPRKPGLFGVFGGLII